MKDIDRLRALLGLNDDRQQVDALEQRVERRDSRTQDVAEVLPEAMDQALADGRLGKTLSKPVESAIHESIAADPKRFADILFPIMGPAIRKSIAEAMRSMMQGINEAVQQSPFSPQGIRWRLEAARTGLPLREVILRHTLAYRVRQAFLLQGESGLLLAHASDEEQAGLDEDAVGAMLTAIQDFTRDSVGDSEAGLSSAELGEYTVWAVPGPVSQLAVIVDGHPPVALRERLREKLEQMHGLFHSWMEEFDGGQETPAELAQLVDECVISVSKSEADRAQQADEKVNRSAKRWVTLLGLALLALLIWWAWASWQERQERRVLADLKQRFAAAPGLVLVNTERDGDEIVVQTLADPLADPPETLISGLALKRPVRLTVDPYQSLDEQIVQRRLLAAVNAPSTVTIAVDGSVARFSGEADFAWLSAAQRFATEQRGDLALDLSGVVESPGSHLQRARELLLPPASVTLDWSGTSVAVAGQASQQWIDRAAAQAREAGLAVDLSSVIATERQRLRRLIESVQSSRLLFDAGARLETSSLARLDTLAVELLELNQLAAGLDSPARVALIGYTDGSGLADRNATLRRARAEVARRELVARGVPGTLLLAQAGPARAPSESVDVSWRRVDLRVIEDSP